MNAVIKTVQDSKLRDKFVFERTVSDADSQFWMSKHTDKQKH